MPSGAPLEGAAGGRTATGPKAQINTATNAVTLTLSHVGIYPFSIVL